MSPSAASNSVTKLRSFFGAMFVTALMCVSYVSWQQNSGVFVNPMYRSTSYAGGPVNNDSHETTSAEVAMTTQVTKMQCVKRLNDIAYIFNRKTGSTTLVTMLDRFGRNHHFPLMRQVLVHKTQRYYGNFYTYHFAGKNPKEAVLPSPPMSRDKRKFLLEGDRTHFINIDKDKLTAEPTVVQTMYVTIVREPSANFESIFSFFHLDRIVRNSHKVSTRTRNKYVSAPDKYTVLNEFFAKPDYYRSSRMRKGSLQWLVGRNSQAWHLGLQHSYHDNRSIVEEYFTQVEKEIDLVIVTEYYDHSLLLLKKLMCWGLSDILYISRRVRSNRTPMSETLKNKIYKWNSVDVQIYDRFNKTLWRRIEAYGPDFKRDLDQYRKLKDAVSDDCGGSSGQLRASTLRLLSEAGENAPNPITFCKTLRQGFTHSFLNVDLHDHGPGSVSVTPRGVGEPLSLKHTSTKNGGPTQCLEVNYAKSHNPTSLKSLDVYFSVNTPHLEVPVADITKRGTDKYTAAFELHNVSNLQVLTEAKYMSTRDFYFQSVHLKGGKC